MSAPPDHPAGVILMYHHIGGGRPDPFSLSVSRSNFAAHLEVLKECARPLALRELNRAILDGQVTPRSVAITFDDGYANNLLAAKPLLENHRIPATVFVTTGFLNSARELWWDELGRLLLQPGVLPSELSVNIRGNSHRWDLGEDQEYTEAASQRYHTWRAWEEPPTARHLLYTSLWRLLQLLPDPERRGIMEAIRVWSQAAPAAREEYRGLSSAELSQLAGGGLIEIGAHTVTHPSLPELSMGQQQAEIVAGKERLEETLRSPVVSFAYPYGAYTAQSVEIVRDSGFEYACATVAGPVDAGTDRFQLPRVQVCDWDEKEFYLRLKGWLEGARDSGAWTSHPGEVYGKPILIRGRWDFRCAGGNVARLLFPDGNAGHARIQIDTLVTPVEFEIQLNLPRLAVKSGYACEIVFRARADASRRLAVGFAQAHEPWDGLGLYSVIEIDTDWRSFRLPFLPTADEDNARIHFDAGSAPVSLEVSDVVLHQQDGGRNP